MRKGARYDREDVIPALARYLGFVRLTDTIREPIKSAINSAIRHGLSDTRRPRDGGSSGARKSVACLAVC